MPLPVIAKERSVRDVLRLMSKTLHAFRKPGGLLSYHQCGMLAGNYVCDCCGSHAKTIDDIRHTDECLITIVDGKL